MSDVRLVASFDNGPADAPVLVLANPIGTTLELWDFQVPVLRRLGFRLLRFNARGHGGSTAPPGPYSLAELGTDVLTLLNFYGVESAAFCGVSLGGMTGLWLAANAPARVTSLVVCCTAVVPMPSRDAWLERVSLVRSGGMAALRDLVPPRWFTPGFFQREPAAAARAVDMLTGCDPEGYAGCAEAIADMDLLPLLGSVKAPTLVLAGELDPAAPPWQGASAARAIPGSRFVVVRGTSHFAHYETPGPVTDAIARHLETRRLPPTSRLHSSTGRRPQAFPEHPAHGVPAPGPAPGVPAPGPAPGVPPRVLLPACRPGPAPGVPARCCCDRAAGASYQDI